MPRASQRTRTSSRDRRKDRKESSPASSSALAVQLTLYISQSSRYARTAQRNCEELLSRVDRRRVRFEVCDVSRHPERAEEDAVCFTPMLVKRHPLPRTYVVGDLSNPAPLVELLESCGIGVVR